MGVLKAVDVLRDAQVVGQPAEHDGKEGDNVGGLEDAVSVLEAVEEFAEGGLFIEVAAERLLGKLSGGFVGGRQSCMMCECVRREQGARRII